MKTEMAYKDYNRAAREMAGHTRNEPARAATAPVFAVDLGVINQGTDGGNSAYVRRLWWLSRPWGREKDQYVYSKTMFYDDKPTRVFIFPSDAHGTLAKNGAYIADQKTANPVDVLMGYRFNVQTVMSVDEAPLEVLGQIKADERMAEWREQRPGTERRPTKARGRVASGARAMWGDGLIRIYLIIGLVMMILALVAWSPVASPLAAVIAGGFWAASMFLGSILGYFSKPSRRR